tara:strand:+ start:782 stop:997 length:216 start_codon:yes stop_codon:yes gene_type:complete
MENEIFKKIELINEKVDRLLEIVETNKQNCEKMEKHITFIENIYDNVKNPLGYLCNSVKSLSRGINYSLEN